MEKKEYIAPKIEVVQLESLPLLLDNNSGLGLAPTSCEPKDLA